MTFDELLELQSRQRAIRTFDTMRPVDDELIEKLLLGATFAPNGGNRQLWRFIVIRDAAIKDELAAVYEEEAMKYSGTTTFGTTSWRDVPVLVAFCSEKGGGGPSIYPAVQNFLLGAGTLGLGSVLTTLWGNQMERVKTILKVPEEIQLHAILPVGWPDHKFGHSKRRPIAEVTYRDAFGAAW